MQSENPLPKILLVTDQPFWRAASGPHQRILSLFKFLELKGFELVIFYMINRNDKDMKLCDSFKAKFVQFDPKPNWWRRSFQRLFARHGNSPAAVSKPEKIAESTSTNSKTLTDYRWPHAEWQFKRIVLREQPDVVVVEYVTWAWLLESIRQLPNPPKTIIDTHDALHVRNAHFQQRGKSHWLDITKKEESEELNRFDLVVSIQQKERELFEQMAPNVEHMVVGHVPWMCVHSHRELKASQADSSSDRTNDPIVLGFLGSNNEANVDGICWFLTECWPKIISATTTPIKLLIGGPIKNAVENKLGSKMQISANEIEFAGMVESIQQYYQRVDIVVNPVRFGSGLKIKTVEAICFGKPLVATTHSTVGLDPLMIEAICLADTPEEFAGRCIKLIEDDQFRLELQFETEKVTETVLSPESVYSGLAAWITRQTATSDSNKPI